MSHWRIEVFNKPGYADAHGLEVLTDIRELGITDVESVSFTKVYLLDGDFDEAFVKRVAQELVTDPVCQDYYIGNRAIEDGQVVEVHLKSGVTDPVAESVTAAIADMGIVPEHVRTAKRFVLAGALGQEQLELIARRVLANDCIEDCLFGQAADPPNPHLQPYQLELTEWPVRQLKADELVELSREKDLFLNLREMETVRQYYRELDREPTDIELETLAQTWSEHCVHKTLKSAIDMDFEGQTVHYENLLKETIFNATKSLDKPWCISVFDDNAGVVEFDEDSAICFKVETHNHPSALDPYGGAATGIGGVIRDPMGTGLGAKPIANTDVFCFGRPDMKLDELPKGVLHPRRIMKGVVAGVRDYGNRMGIPTVNGALYFDDRYLANPLVFCGNVGVMDKNKCFGEPKTGNLIVVLGGRTGRDGIHGATFSSGQMTHEHETIFSHAVQIGNPIVEKKMLDVLLQARDENLYEAVTDCGAGGLSSAVGEMGEKLGAEVDLDKVPLKYAGLSYTEIWISEAQERMVIAVKAENIERVKQLFDAENVEATVIGKFTDDKKLTLRYDGTVVGQLDMEFLHDGVPKFSRKAQWRRPEAAEPVVAQAEDYNEQLKSILSSYNVASKEWVIRQYDHEVQGGSVVKPLTGIANDGPSDAAVIQPKYESDRGVAIACGMNPLYGDIDPYWMALSGIDEAIRNLVSVGARFDRIAILDNFCWGNCDRPETLGSLVRAAQACRDGALGFEVPFISGKDSLNNEFQTDQGDVIAIPSTLLISGISLVDDVNKCVTMDVKRPGNVLFAVGLTKNELGGSHYYKLAGKLGANVPTVDIERSAETARRISQAIAEGLVVSCHDCSEGGLAVALAEMAFAGGLGVEARAQGVPRSDDCTRIDQILFSESNSRYIVEIEPENFDRFAKLMLNMPFGQIGRVTDAGRLVVRDLQGKAVIDEQIDTLKQAWQKTFNW